MSDLFLQGRRINAEDLAAIRDLIAKNSSAHRSHLSLLLCELWNWRTPIGRLKDIAARTLLRKLEDRGLVTLPARLTRKLSGLPKPSPLESAARFPVVQPLLWAEPYADTISATLAELRPLRIERVDTPEQRIRVFAFLRDHHYLGFTRSVGENVGYLIFDSHQRLLAVSWFGAPAWKAADRDRFIGWSALQRERNLGAIVNNVRFLIAPWVHVNHLASHILGLLTRRLAHDWLQKYGHAVVLLETFIEEGRFHGTCYRAANWTVVGRTKGRSRQDRHLQLRVPPKLIALLPLVPHWRQRLLENPSP